MSTNPTNTKNSTIRKLIIWFLFFGLLIIVSYYREVIFLSLNQLLDGNKNFYAKTQEFDWLLKLNSAELIKLKYILTPIFSILFAASTLLGLHLSFKSKPLNVIGIGLYVSIYLGLIIILITAFFFSDFKTFYPSMRTIMGFTYNPLIYLILSITYISINDLKKIEN